MSQLTTLFTDIANAIREKTGKSDKIKAENFPQEIKNISITPSITVTSEEIDISSYVGQSAATIALSKSGYELHKTLFVEFSYFGHSAYKSSAAGNIPQVYGDISYSLSGSTLTLDLSSFGISIFYGYQAWYSSEIIKLKITVYYLDIN